MTGSKVPWWDAIELAYGENPEQFIPWAHAGLCVLAVKNSETLYQTSFTGYTLKELLPDCLRDVQELGGAMVFETSGAETTAPEDDIRSIERAFAWPNALVVARAVWPDSHFSIQVFSLDKSLIGKCSAIAKKYARPVTEVKQAAVFMLGSQHGRLTTFNLGTGGIPLVRENYTQDVLAAYDRMHSDLCSPTPFGRLGIFTGPPGTGKTYLIRGLIASVPGVFIIVPASMMAALADPGLVPTLLSEKEEHRGYPMILIIEDGDAALVPRQMDNIGTISNLLNSTSGIFGELLDLRVIATTNSNRIDIEPALLRSGRLMAWAEVPPLPMEQAVFLYTQLTGRSEIPSKVLVDQDGKQYSTRTLSEVYRLARDDGWEPPTTRDPVHATRNRANARLKHR